MPYNSVADVPDHVPKSKRKQWLEVWNSSYAQHHDEGRAFAEANSVVSGKIKVDMFGKPLIKAVGTSATGFVRAVDGPFKCAHCAHMSDAVCHQEDVLKDPEVKDLLNDDGFLPVDAGDCCNEYDPVQTVSAEKAKAMTIKFRKFVPFVKVDEAKREVAGIVTAEVPDKDMEVCDYEGSKPYYQAVISEMGKATDGKNLFPLREMHQLKAAGKCTGFQFKDSDKEIVMTFKVVDDDAWKKVAEGVYTGFSQGGSIVGDLTPDPVYKNCKRYTADPSEVSLVDNPCLGVAHFAYVKADGQLELRKLRMTKADGPIDGGGDVPVGSSTPEPVVIPPALTPEEEEEKRKKELEALESDSRKAVDALRVTVRKWVGRNITRISKLTKKRQELLMYKLDTDLTYLTRKQPLAKGLYEVSRLACSIQEMAYMVCYIGYEQEDEGDDSVIAEKLAANVSGLLDTFLEYAEEEAAELKEHLSAAKV